MAAEMDEHYPHQGTSAGAAVILSRKQASQLMVELSSDWRLTPDGREIRREFRFRDFHETMAFVNAVAWISHREGHPFEFVVGQNRCLIRLTTRTAGGLTEPDFVCAARIDALVD